MEHVGRLLIFLGLVILGVGTVFYFFGDNLSWLGNLPGDIKIDRDNFSFYFPLTTMILISLIINIIIRIIRFFF